MGVLISTALWPGSLCLLCKGKAISPRLQQAMPSPSKASAASSST